MRRFALLAFTLAFVLSTQAQMNRKEKKEKPATAWKTGGMFALMGGQSGARNWAPTGSEKFTFAAMSSLNLWATRNWKKNTWDNSFDFSYALVNAQSAGIRKMDDKIDLYSKYSHGFGTKGNLAVGVVGALRTQFTNGYDYTEGRKRVSGFFAPAYATFSPGLQFKTRNSAFSAHIGPDVRWVIVSNAPYSYANQGGANPDGTPERTLASKYGVNAGEQVRYEIGLYGSLLFKKELCKNVSWKTRLDLNSDFRGDNPFQIDTYWTNVIGMTVNKWLKVNYSFDLYQDDDVKMFGPGKNEAKVQMRSLLGVGLGVTF